MKKLIFSCLAVLFSQEVLAGINLKNGNFYISYTDLIPPGGNTPINMEVGRTYNSKSGANKDFGYGWGSSFLTYIAIQGDRSLVVHENGSGAASQYRAKKTGIQICIAQIT